MKKRLFVAVFPPRAVVQRVLGLAKKPQFKNLPLKWVTPDNVHLTLYFLGNAAEDEIAKISQKLYSVSEKAYAFSLNLRGVGLMPNSVKPNTLVARFQENTDLLNLHHQIKKALGPKFRSYTRRNFRSHLTLARYKGHSRQGEVKLRELPAVSLGDFPAFKANSFYLIESILQSPQSRFVKLRQFKLR